MSITHRAQQVLDVQIHLAHLAMQIPSPPENAEDRHVLGYQEMGLSFHHAMSIASHVQRHGHELAASAFALARPMLETLQRGWWFTLCATDDQIARFIAEDRFPIRTALEVAAAIDAADPFAGTGYFTGLSQEEWNVYNSFTHGGMFALDAYGNRPGVHPGYDPERIAALLDNAQRFSGVAAMGMAWIGRIYDPVRSEPIYRSILAAGPLLGANAHPE